VRVKLVKYLLLCSLLRVVPFSLLPFAVPLLFLFPGRGMASARLETKERKQKKKEKKNEKKTKENRLGHTYSPT